MYELVFFSQGLVLSQFSTMIYLGTLHMTSRPPYQSHNNQMAVMFGVPKQSIGSS